MVTVFRPVKGQSVRLGISRVFRKPAFLDARLHPMAEFPDDSLITGDGQQAFQEFIPRTIGNPNINNEELLPFEAGYLGQFLDGELSVAVNIYFTQLRKLAGLSGTIVETGEGLPDLDQSIIRADNNQGDDVNDQDLMPYRLLDLILSAPGEEKMGTGPLLLALFGYAIIPVHLAGSRHQGKTHGKQCGQ